MGCWHHMQRMSLFMTLHRPPELYLRVAKSSWICQPLGFTKALADCWQWAQAQGCAGSYVQWWTQHAWLHQVHCTGSKEAWLVKPPVKMQHSKLDAVTAQEPQEGGSLSSPWMGQLGSLRDRWGIAKGAAISSVLTWIYELWLYLLLCNLIGMENWTQFIYASLLTTSVDMNLSPLMLSAMCACLCDLLWVFTWHIYVFEFSCIAVFFTCHI